MCSARQIAGPSTRNGHLLSRFTPLAFFLRQRSSYCAFNFTGYAAGMTLSIGKALLLALLVAFTAGMLRAQGTDASHPPGLNAAQIAAQLQRHTQAQAVALRGYKALRHYQVEYSGFAARIGAKMDVEVSYDSATGKSLRIVSQSGSGILCDKVLKRAVESEREAAQDKSSTALSEANYQFVLLGSEEVAGRPAYILDVQPHKPSKFLFRGKIWVDSADFAVVKMEAEPAKSPSFWISKTLIHSSSVKTDGFWLPQQVRSETKVRIGGTATLTIDYGTYKVVSEEMAMRGSGS